MRLLNDVFESRQNVARLLNDVFESRRGVSGIKTGVWINPDPYFDVQTGYRAVRTDFRDAL